MARAEFEGYAGGLRVWTTDEDGYGDTFQWSAAWRRIDRVTLEIGPYQNQIPPSVWREVIKEAQAMGIETVIARTYPEGCRGVATVKRIRVPSKFEQIYK